MSGKDFYPPPGQQEPTSEYITVKGEQSSGQTKPQQLNIPPGQQHNMPVSKQTMPQQYMQNNQQPMPQMQYGQQQMPQQQFYQPQYQQQMPQQKYQQQMPQQQYQQQMPQQQYQQQMPQQQYAQPLPQQYVQPMPNQATPQYYQQMPNAQMMPGQIIGHSPSPFLTTPIQPWTTGLFDCANDLENCLITTFFPCITFGQIAEITDRGMSSCTGAGLIYGLLLYFTGFHWIYSWLYRTRLRALYSLQEDPYHDCLVHFCCDPCALCQEYRELQNRGFRMQLGWIGNMQLQAQSRAATNAPPPVQGMTR